MSYLVRAKFAPAASLTTSARAVHQAPAGQARVIRGVTAVPTSDPLIPYANELISSVIRSRSCLTSAQVKDRMRLFRALAMGLDGRAVDIFELPNEMWRTKEALVTLKADNGQRNRWDIFGSTPLVGNSGLGLVTNRQFLSALAESTARYLCSPLGVNPDGNPTIDLSTRVNYGPVTARTSIAKYQPRAGGEVSPAAQAFFPRSTVGVVIPWPNSPR